MTPDLIPAWVDGVLTPVEKLEVHQRGLRHKAISVFVMREGKLLIQRRALGKYHTPGLWANTCCTHPHWDESHTDCAHRRIEQELGITGVVAQHRGQVEYRADVGNNLIEHEVVQMYLCDADADMPLKPNPDEVMDTDWVTPAELEAQIAARPETFTPWMRIYLAEHSDLIFGKAIPA